MVEIKYCSIARVRAACEANGLSREDWILARSLVGPIPATDSEHDLFDGIDLAAGDATERQRGVA